MNLKKTDKIIAGVAVLVLIVAAIGIIFYTTYEGDESIDETPSTNKYDVTWEFNNKTITFDGYAGTDSTYKESLLINAQSGSVLTGVNVKVDWTDDKTYNLLFILRNQKRGLDTLTAEFTYVGSTETLVSTGEGTDEEVSFSINSKPADDYVEADSMSDVADMIYAEYGDLSDATIDAIVNVERGEKMYRLLRFLLDKGNNFEIEVEYEYYTYSIEQIESEDNDDTEEDVLPSGAAGLGEYRKMVSNGRGWI